MPTLDLSAPEIALLREVLDSVLSDLGMEIAGTDSHDYRASLKERRELLRKIVATLERAS